MPNKKLMLQIDFRSGLPIYTQIVNQVQAQVAGGVLKPGDQLPTVRALAEDLRVNFNTVARALGFLHQTEKLWQDPRGRMCVRGSRFAASNIGGFAAQARSFDEVRDIVKWNTAGPRLNAIYDITGDGKTAAKAAAGRYYYILSTGGGGVSKPQPLSSGIDSGLNVGQVFPLIVNQRRLTSHFRQGSCFSRAARRSLETLSPTVQAAAPPGPPPPGPPASGPPAPAGHSNSGFGNGEENNNTPEANNPGKGKGGPHSP